jgi:hypothetical protein
MGHEISMFAKIWSGYVRTALKRRDALSRITNNVATHVGVCALALLLFFPSHRTSAREAHGAEIDTEHFFGFTIGSDIGEKGEKEFESETTSHMGKSGGSYTALFEQLEAKYTLAQNFRIAAAAVFAYHDVSNVPDLEDRRQGRFQGLLLDARYRMLDRERSPVGLTVSIEPHWSRIDDLTGERVRNWGGAVTLILDKELVSRRLYAAINLFYQPEETRFPDSDGWVRQSTIGVSGALVTQVKNGIFIGAELRSFHFYESLGFSNFSGRALFVGPTFYANLSKQWWLSLAWRISNGTARFFALAITSDQ